MLRFLRNVLIEFVFAGALTSLVLGYVAVGAVLLLVGGVMISLTQRGHKLMSFGLSR
ncbi:hypothetical protein [Actinomycetospora termitidis]|uniref:Uncharacterized protein n=1 Tax=Actinomycetospora termitidis TaxID=3053470 RepID=A0ABT7MHI3_9PSEU|nr:hypothetical protein [Actinomycetospora sp. Odt1-22]MDL5160148.1 hypothetical protein [Actinomycetospora sp. Odt1-22]